jgi:hypothetical protein
MTNEEWYKLERVVKSARTPGQYKVARKYTEQLVESKRPVMADEDFRFVRRMLIASVTLGALIAFGIIVIALSVF